MYGGFTHNMYTNNESFLQDTWSYDYNTNTWTEMNPSTIPPPLGTHESAYDSESGKIILFGGKSFASGDYSTLTNHQTWVYDYSENSWVNMTTDLHPSRRAIGMMAYNSRIDRICFYGGYDGVSILGDTWYYDFNENLWELIDTTTSPGSRFHHTLDYDSESDNVVLFGGRTQLGLLVFSDETWVFHSPINIPDSPVNLQAILIENNYVELSWTPPITTTNPPISNYTIYRGTESGELNVLYGTLDLSFIDTTVIDGQTYYYTLRALNALGEGDATDEISIEIPLITTTSSTPGFTILLLSLYLTILITLRRNKRA